MLQIAIYRKQTDRQDYLDVRSEHLKLPKDSILYSETLWIKQIFSLQEEFLSHTAKMINQFQKRGCNRSLIEQQIDKANLQERTTFKRKRKDTATTIPLSLNYNRTLPKIKEIFMKHWHLLHINPNLAEMFQNPSILAFCRNRNLRDIIGIKLIENGKVKKKFTKKIQGKCTPRVANNRTLCCKEVVHTTTFRSNQTNRIFQIYHTLNCKSKYVVYLLQCTKCKMQCVGNAETEFNIKLNNYRNDVWKPDAIPASHHFSGKIHNFNTHAKFLLIEQICHINIDKEKNKERIKQSMGVFVWVKQSICYGCICLFLIEIHSMQG